MLGCVLHCAPGCGLEALHLPPPRVLDPRFLLDDRASSWQHMRSGGVASAILEGR